MPDWHDGWVECVKLVMDRGVSGGGVDHLWDRWSDRGTGVMYMGDSHVSVSGGQSGLAMALSCLCLAGMVGG